jgi:spermidine/putrescine transport system permease protein
VFRSVRISLGICTGLILLFLYLPIGLLVAYSFNQSRLNIVWTGFTLRWYRELWGDRELMTALGNSVLIALAVTMISVPLGTAGAWAMSRYRFPLRRMIDAMVLVPVVIPEVIMGVSLLIFFVAIGFERGYWTVILAHVTFCFPYVLIGVRARLAGLDPSLEEAAMDLGATQFGALVRVIIPYLWPAIAAGALMSFALSIDELIITQFVVGPSASTLPVKIFGLAKIGLNPKLDAISALFIVTTALAVLIAGRIGRVRHRSEA